MLLTNVEHNVRLETLICVTSLAEWIVKGKRDLCSHPSAKTKKKSLTGVFFYYGALWFILRVILIDGWWGYSVFDDVICTEWNVQRSNCSPDYFCWFTELRDSDCTHLQTCCSLTASLCVILSIPRRLLNYMHTGKEGTIFQPRVLPSNRSLCIYMFLYRMYDPISFSIHAHR